METIVDQPYVASKCTPIDKVVEMAQKEIDAIRNIDEVTFREFFQSRIVRTQAVSAPRYAIKVVTKAALISLYYAAFKMYQFGEGLPEDR